MNYKFKYNKTFNLRTLIVYTTDILFIIFLKFQCILKSIRDSTTASISTF